MLQKLLLVFFFLFSTCYCLRSFGDACHFEEWTGRGLYPALALASGFDLYETQNGPLITLYGFGMALFYVLSGFASHPSTAINIAYLTNLLGLLAPLYYLSRKFYQDRGNSLLETISLPLISAILVLFCLQLEKTTSGILNIHADTPALSFILIGLCFFQHYESNKSNKFLVLATLSLSFAIWSKLPTLPTLFFPFFYLLLNQRFKESLLYILLASIIFLGVSALIFGPMGSMMFIIILFNFHQEVCGATEMIYLMAQMPF